MIYEHVWKCVKEIDRYWLGFYYSKPFLEDNLNKPQTRV